MFMRYIIPVWWLLSLILGTIGFSPVANGQVGIDEIMYHPASERAEEQYVELFNRGSQDVGLGGWKLKRGINYTFGAGTILPAGGYLVVAADLAAFRSKYPSVTNVVGNWSGHLNHRGEEIELENQNGSRIDLVFYATEGDFGVRRAWPPDPSGWVWYAQHNGFGKSLELRNPALPRDQGQNWTASLADTGTPGSVNSVFSPDIPPLILQVRHQPVLPRSSDSVSVTARLVDEQRAGLNAILFFRNASSATPPAFSSAPMFDDGQHQDGAPADGIYGAVLPPEPNGTVIEFYVEAIDSGGKGRTWPAPAQLTGGALVQAANALYQVEDEAYSGPQPVYRIVMTEADRQRLENSRSSDAQMNATLVVADGTGLETHHNGGLGYQKGANRNTPVAPYRLDLPSDRPWNDRTSFNLSSHFPHSTLMGEVLALQAGLPAPWARPVQFRINGINPAPGQAPYYGSFLDEEVVDGAWAARLFPKDGDGNVYFGGPPNADLRYLGSDPSSYQNAGYAKESNGSEDDWSDLMALTLALDPATTPDASYLTAVRDNLRVDDWLRYFAVMTLMGYNGSALATGAPYDYHLYRGTEDRRFLVAPRNLGQAFGQGDVPGQVNASIFLAANLTAMNRFLHQPEIEPAYFAELRRQLETTFATNRLFALFDQFLGDWVPGPTIASMKTFAAARLEGARAQLPPAPVSVRAVISGEPPALTYLTEATLTVSGEGVTHYRYRLNQGPYDMETPVAVPIRLQGLANGDYTAFVLGRNADGVWQSDPNPTVSETWTVDMSLAAVVINEFLAQNNSAVNKDGTFPDLIELYNAGTATVDLRGWRVTDRVDTPKKFTFPAGVTIAPGSYLVLYANDPDGTGGIHLGFSLKQGGEGVFLFKPGSDPPVDGVDFGFQLPDLSSGRLPSGRWGLCQPTFGAANVPAPTARPEGLRINEWLADNAPPFGSDFIELYNPDPLPLDVGGCYLTDQPIGLPFEYRVSPLNYVAGFGYFLILADGDPSQGPSHLGFKLAKELGQIALFAPNQTPIDDVIYSSQRSGTTQGRSPNGGDPIRFLDVPTPGSPNPALDNPQTANVVLNEILARNASLKEPDGSEPDLVELFNPANTPADVSDMSLSDQPINPRRWIFPSGTVIPAQGYLVLRMDDSSPATTAPSPFLNTGFALSSSGSGLYLFDAAANSGSLVDAITFGIQIPDWSIGRLPDGSTNWSLTLPTFGSLNLAASVGNPALVKINEWMARPDSGPDWFELYNPAAQPVAVGGYHLTDNLTVPTKFEIAPLSFVNARGYQLFLADGNPAAGADHASFGLSSGSGSIGLADESGRSIDAVIYGSQTLGVSQGRFPDGTETIVDFTEKPTPGAGNYLLSALVVVNEVLTYALPPYSDVIELHNLSQTEADVSGWYLSDDLKIPRKYRLPSGTFIPAGGYLALDEETAFNQFTSPGQETFSFSADGEDVFLFAADANGELTGFADGYSFGAAEGNVSFGRYVTSALNDHKVEFVAMSSFTPFAPNSKPKVGPAVISEIMYHPPGLPGSIGANNYGEYIELLNISPSSVNLFDPDYPTNTWKLAGGVSFQFPPGLILPVGGVLLLVRFDPVLDAASLEGFRSAYNVPATIPLAGPYHGQLGNAADTLELYKPDASLLVEDPTNGHVRSILVERITYSDALPWPAAADGSGASLRRIFPGEFGNDPVNWMAGSPTPGVTNAGSYLLSTPVVVNEILTYEDLPSVDVIELHNRSQTESDVSGWYLTDNLYAPKKYRLTSGTVIPAGGYLILDESDFNQMSSPGQTPFSFSADGAEVYLLAADGTGELTGFGDGYSFGPADANVSFGRYVTSALNDHKVEFVAMSSFTPSAPNSKPRVGPVVISEIMYHPPEPSGSVGINNLGKYIELQNIAPLTVPLFDPANPINTWKLAGGVDFEFPPGFSLPVGGVVLLVGFDPSLDAASLAAFRSTYDIPATVPILGPYQDQLVDATDTIELYKLDVSSDHVRFVLIERVTYSNLLPWPTEADGSGLSVQRISPDEFGNDPINWTAAAPTPGNLPGPDVDQDGDGLPDLWELNHGLDPSDPSDAGQDWDGDGVVNLHEYLAGTDPNDPESVLNLEVIDHAPVTLRFTAQPGRSYFIEYQELLNPHQVWRTLTNFAALPNRTTIQVIDPALRTSRFYRIRVPPE
jgi:Lamin Tail Domain/CotH kinase protein